LEADTLYKEQEGTSRVKFRENSADELTKNLKLQLQGNTPKLIPYIIDVNVSNSLAVIIGLIFVRCTICT